MSGDVIINILKALDMTIILLIIVGNTVVGVVSVTDHPISFLLSYGLAVAGFVFLAFGYLLFSYIAAGGMVAMFVYHGIRNSHRTRRNSDDTI